MAARSTRSRLVAVVVEAAIVVSVTTACSPPASTPDPVPSSAESKRPILYPDMHAALMATDPRIVDTGMVQSRSGAALVLTVGVFVNGDEPISTENLTAMLVAVRDNMPDNVD